MEFKFPVITISRQYAAWGHTITRAISERLDIPFYDKDFVKETAALSGYTEEDIKNEGESISKASQIVNTLFNPVSSYTSASDAIYRAQKEIVLKLAQEKKPCIILGRCADHILQQAGIPALKVFLYADLDKRIARAAEMEENRDAKNVRKVVEKMDSRRETYYKKYTGTSMGSFGKYDISLNVGEIGITECVNILCGIIEGSIGK
jgi:cytidylate kinase